MKTCIKLCSFALLAVASVVSIESAQTNVVQNLTFKMTAWYQGTTVTNGTTVTVNAVNQSIATKDVINWLALATTNNFTNAQLLVVNQLGVPDSKSVIIVRTKTQISKTQAVTNNVDVSGFFFATVPVATVNSYSYNNANNVVNPGKYYGYWEFYLLENAGYPLLPVTFQVSGFGVDSAINVLGTKKQVLGLADQFSITNAAGYGEVNGRPFIITGNITISGKTLETSP